MRATSIGHAGILIETDFGSILCDPWFVPGVLRFVVRVPAQRPAARRAACSASSTRLPVHQPHPRRPPGRVVAGAPRQPRHHRAGARLSRRTSWSGAARARLQHFIRTVDGQELDARAAICASRSTSRSASPTVPAATRRWSSATARRGWSTRTTAAPPTSTRCAPTARSTCTGSSTAARSGTRWCTTSRPSGCASWWTPRSTASCRAMRYVEAVEAARGGAQRRPTGVPRPRAVPPERDHRRRAEHLPRPAGVHRPARRRRATPASWPSPARPSI